MLMHWYGLKKTQSRFVTSDQVVLNFQTLEPVRMVSASATPPDLIPVANTDQVFALVGSQEDDDDLELHWWSEDRTASSTSDVVDRPLRVFSPTDRVDLAGNQQVSSLKFIYFSAFNTVPQNL